MTAAQLTLKLTAGRSTNPGLKPAEAPRASRDARRHAARRRVNVKCGERRAALPAGTRGLAAA